MKVLQINIFYDEGSTGKIVSDIHYRLLRDGHESYIVFGRGKQQVCADSQRLYRTTSDELSTLYRKISRVTGLRYNTAYWETYRLIRHIEKIKPDVVHIHCMNCAYIQPFILLKYLGRQNYPVLVTHHADVTITANCDHAFECDKWKFGCGKCLTLRSERRSFFIDATHWSWKQMRHAFGKVGQLYASGVSDWMTNRVLQSPFFKGVECRTILNGLDVEAFHYRRIGQEFRKKLGITDEDKVIVHVTPNFSAPIKGGTYVLELAKRMSHVKFIIVGIKDFEVTNLPENIIAIYHVGSKEDLSYYYSIADVTLLTSFRESFSMVTAESLCCGTPVVGFKAGAPETIAIPEYSDFVNYGNVDELQKAVNKYLAISVNKELIANRAKIVYDAEIMYRNYLDYYNSILQ